MFKFSVKARSWNQTLKGKPQLHTSEVPVSIMLFGKHTPILTCADIAIVQAVENRNKPMSELNLMEWDLTDDKRKVVSTWVHNIEQHQIDLCPTQKISFLNAIAEAINNRTRPLNLLSLCNVYMNCTHKKLRESSQMQRKIFHLENWLGYISYH